MGVELLQEHRPLAAVGVAGSQHFHFVFGVQPGQTAGLDQGVQNIVLVGRQLDH